MAGLRRTARPDRSPQRRYAVNIVLFGARGRLGSLCAAELPGARTEDVLYEYQRDGTFTSRGPDGVEGAPLRASELMRALRNRRVVFCDCSVDHSSTEAMRRHERTKHDLCAWLNDQGALHAAIGFSSGIAWLDESSIRLHADHMRAYREVKLEQERLYATLRCRVFIPALFTLVGARTYQLQATAWAMVLKQRVAQGTGLVLHDPLTRRFWVAETSVRRALKRFLGGAGPERVSGPLVDGVFSLDDVARVELPGGLPALSYAVGASSAWHDGDYLCAHEFVAEASLPDALQSCLEPS